MSVTVTSEEKFKNVSPQDLYNLYMDPAMLEKATGAPATMDGGIGADYMSYGGYCTGKNLHLIPGELIVQTWHGAGFVEQDSILVLRLEAQGTDTVMYMTHCNVTAEQGAKMKEDWRAYFWDKFRALLAGEPIPVAAGM